jgi:hypothetical protein
LGPLAVLGAGGIALAAATPLPPVAGANRDVVPQDDFSKNLRGAWESATTDPKVGKADKVLLQMGMFCSWRPHEISLSLVENGAAGAMEKETKGAAIVSSVKTGLETVGGMEAIEKGINSFMDGMPVLMNALDEVAKIHPYALFFFSNKPARID